MLYRRVCERRIDKKTQNISKLSNLIEYCCWQCHLIIFSFFVNFQITKLETSSNTNKIRRQNEFGVDNNRNIFVCWNRCCAPIGAANSVPTTMASILQITISGDDRSAGKHLFYAIIRNTRSISSGSHTWNAQIFTPWYVFQILWQITNDKSNNDLHCLFLISPIRNNSHRKLERWTTT